MSNTKQDLHARAILVSLNLSAWSGKKFDKRVTREALAAQGASEGAGRFNKDLLPSNLSIQGTTYAHGSTFAAKNSQALKQVQHANSHKALMAHMAAVRVWHYEQTLKWSDGWQLLPIKNYQAYTDGIRERQHEFNRLLAEFLHDYPALRDAAKTILNGMFEHGDYPSDMAKRFSFDIEFNPVPSGGDFRVALSDAEIEAIASSAENRVKAQFEAAQKEAIGRLYERVEKIVSALSSPDAIFRDTLIGNARDLCDVLERLNVTGDPRLEKYRRETELLAMSEPETLRKVPAVRAETAARAQSILDDMQKTFGKGLFS
jgi:hypothetical protein